MLSAAGMPASRSLCNDSHLQEQDGQCVVVGDPTEGALIVAAGKASLTSSGTGNAQAGYDSFESDFQYMATLQANQIS